MQGYKKVSLRAFYARAEENFGGRELLRRKKRGGLHL
jgi:hypothetical protein